MLTSLLAPLAFASTPFVCAHGTGGGTGGNLTGLQQALYADGLYQFSNIIGSLNSTFTGGVLTQLSEGNNTVFGPTDRALSCLAPETLNNQTALANVVAYHVVPGNYVNETAKYPNVTIGRTMLNDSSVVMLEGNKSQVLVWSQFENGTIVVMNQESNVTVCNSTNYNDTTILVVDSVLKPPSNISTVLSTSPYNLTLLLGYLNSTRLPNGSSALDALSSTHGVTLFAPTNEALQAAQNSLAGISNNQTALEAVALNHVINGTSAYSTEFLPSNYTSAAGQKFNFAYNSSGYYVTSGGTNPVQIVGPNQLASNGVVHIVNGVMLDTNLNAVAASSAYASATAAAAEVSPTGPPGPVTATFTHTTGSSTGTSSHSTGSDTSTSTGTATDTTSTGTGASTTTATSGAAKDMVDMWQIGPLLGIVIVLCQFV